MCSLSFRRSRYEWKVWKPNQGFGISGSCSTMVRGPWEQGGSWLTSLKIQKVVISPLCFKLPDHKLLKLLQTPRSPSKSLKLLSPNSLNSTIQKGYVFQRWADTPGLNLVPAADCADDAVQQHGLVVLAQQPMTSRAGSSWVNGWTFTSNKWRRTP